jgi:hypothetical protein
MVGYDFLASAPAADLYPLKFILLDLNGWALKWIDLPADH